MPPQNLSLLAGRESFKRKACCMAALLALLTGCAAFDQQTGFSNVSATIEARSGRRVVWNSGTELDVQAVQEVRKLLQNTLTADKAIQIALLNNRELQATYAEMGVAQADLVQAGLLRNPIFNSVISFPASGGQTNLDLGVAVNFLDIFYLPFRKRVAAARFEEAKLRVAATILDFAADVQRAFYRCQADEQMLELLQTIKQALAISFEVAQRLHAAGNITDLDLARERVLLEQAKLDQRTAEVSARLSREELNTLMGLWGQQTAWRIDTRLPDVPEQPLLLSDLESQALRQSLDLAIVRQRLIAAGELAGLNRETALFPETRVGVAAEREEKAWEIGPTIEFPLPLFDQGQARIGRAMAEVRRAEEEYYFLGVRIRSTARALQERLQGAQDRALYYRDILLPLRERIVNETQLQYNAMQLGVFDLLRAREEQIQAAITYVESLHNYWLARADLAQMLSGRLPDSGGFAINRKLSPQNYE